MSIDREHSDLGLQFVKETSKTVQQMTKQMSFVVIGTLRKN